MIPEITTLPSIPPSARLKTLLAEGGITCSLITLAPSDETSRSEAREGSEQLLIVLDGQATVRIAEVSTMLNPEGALLVVPGSAYSLAASPVAGARLLRIELPVRRAAEPVIHSFDR